MIMLQRNNTRTNKRAKIFDYPDDSQRLIDQEIKGEEEYFASLKSNIEDDPWDKN